MFFVAVRFARLPRIRLMLKCESHLLAHTIDTVASAMSSIALAPTMPVSRGALASDSKYQNGTGTTDRYT